jgi:hypothetical protein
VSANDGVYVVSRGNSFSVAVVSAIDNLDFYRAVGGVPYEEYVESIWGNGRNFPDYDSAIEYAKTIDVDTEYGVQYLGNV